MVHLDTQRLTEKTGSFGHGPKNNEGISMGRSSAALRQFSCAEAEELITRSKRLAFDREKNEITRDDLLQAIRTFRIDSSTGEGLWKAAWNKPGDILTTKLSLMLLKKNKIYENEHAACSGM